MDSIVDDEEGHRGEVDEQPFARSVERRIGDLFDERVGLAIDDAVALLDRRATARLGKMAVAGAGWPKVVASDRCRRAESCRVRTASVSSSPSRTLPAALGYSSSSRLARSVSRRVAVLNSVA